MVLLSLGGVLVSRKRGWEDLYMEMKLREGGETSRICLSELLGMMGSVSRLTCTFLDEK